MHTLMGMHVHTCAIQHVHTRVMIHFAKNDIIKMSFSCVQVMVVDVVSSDVGLDEVAK